MYGAAGPRPQIRVAGRTPGRAAPRPASVHRVGGAEVHTLSSSSTLGRRLLNRTTWLASRAMSTVSLLAACFPRVLTASCVPTDRVLLILQDGRAIVVSRSLLSGPETS